MRWRGQERTGPMASVLMSEPETESKAPLARKPLWRRRPPTGVAGAVFWLALWFGLLWLFRQVPSVGGSLLGWMQVLVGLALIALAIPLAWRLLQQRLLWSLRNKLILTYLLIGLAPVVLFRSLAAISAYIAAGQFSIHLADTRMRQQLEEMGTQNSARATMMARAIRDFGERSPGAPAQGQPGFPRRPGPGPAGPHAANGAAPGAPAEATVEPLGEEAPNPLFARLHRHTAMYLNGAPLFALPPVAAASATGAQPSAGSTPVVPPESAPGRPTLPLGLPPWAADLRGNDFRQLGV